MADDAFIDDHYRRIWKYDEYCLNTCFDDFQLGHNVRLSVYEHYKLASDSYLLSYKHKYEHNVAGPTSWGRCRHCGWSIGDCIRHRHPRLLSPSPAIQETKFTRGSRT